MIRMSLAQLADVVGGRLAGVDPAVEVADLVTDSRTVADRAGPVGFVARRGEQQDGHDHAPGAVDAGAVAVVSERALDGLPCLVVEDADDALRTLARHVRDTVDPLVVGITGSVGKTTTKDFTHAACAASRRTVAARGSFNNEMGVPLTLLETREDTEVLVVEMGARGPGQVAELAAWARPDVGVVTAVAGVHLELFGSLDEVASTKGELVAALPDDGTAVLNADDDRVVAMAGRTRARVLRCSPDGAPDADVVADQVELDRRARATFTARTPWGDHRVSLPVAGRHQVGNALLALAAAGAAGADVAAAAHALGRAPVSRWRGAVVELGGVVVLDDAYNANPTSTLAALGTLAEMQVDGSRVAVLGVMAEIGDQHEAEHWRVGLRAAGRLDHLVVVGEDAEPIASGAREAGLDRIDVVADAEAAVRALDDLAPGDALLVKASRVAALDQVTEALRARFDHEDVEA